MAAASLVNTSNSPQYLLSGDPSPAYHFFARAMLAEIERRSFTYRSSPTRIKAAEHDNEAGLYGARLTRRLRCRSGRSTLTSDADHIKDNAGVALDDVIESPILVDTSLPQILRFVVLLGVERGMPEILGEESDLLVKRFPDSR